MTDKAAPAEEALRTSGAQAQTFATTLLFDTEDGRPISPPRRLAVVVGASLARALVRAARLARSDMREPPLTFSTLLVAMIVDEEGWLHAQFERQGASLEQVAAHRSYEESELGSAVAQDLAAEYLATSSARAALEEALRIAARASGAAVLDLRHLCAAYPVLANWHEADFTKFAIDRLEWARALGAEMARRFPGERHFWGSYADRASPVPLTSFSADVYTQEDLLDIDRGVDALALLIASTHTVTPLAIGVFGPWGSGKSFFMRHLQRRIVGLRQDEQARIAAWQDKRQRRVAQPADAPLYFGEIVQVEFNAWHYNEGNLVASLVEHLFRNLRVLPDEPDAELARRQAAMLGQLNALQGRLASVEQTIDAARRNVAAAQGSVEQASQAAAQARAGIDEAARQIERQGSAFADERRQLDDALRALDLAPGQVDADAAIAVALGPLGPLVGEVRAALAQVREQALDWRAFAARLLSAKGLAVLALCLGAPLMLWLTRLLEGQWAALAASLAAAAGAFGGAFEEIKAQRARFELKLAELEAEQARRVAIVRASLDARASELQRQAQQRLAELTQALETRRAALASQEQRLAQAARDLSARVQEHDASLSERDRAEQQVRAAEAELQRLSSALLLEEFIKDRLSTDEYRKQLGFLALVRRDIERLSQLIDQANRHWLSADRSDPPPLVNRIVLYIDDLDRCKESTVLAVLEAVHLLLAFPLFVCAVAVDPRWVAKCLRAAHRQLFLDEEAAQREGARNLDDAAGDLPPTVGDYLEKIFQIPIWMAPIEARQRAALVNALLGPTASPLARRPGEGPSGSAAAATTTARSAPRTDAFEQLVSKAREVPDPLRITPDEAAFIGEIAALLSDRPRALKRLVNTYRLLKASLPDLDRASFVDDAPSSAYRVCLTQLALFTSHPRLTPPLVAALTGTRPLADAPTGGGDDPQGPTLEAWFASLPTPLSPELAAARQLIVNRNALRLEAFRAWLPHTSRYLFHRAA